MSNKTTSRYIYLISIALYILLVVVVSLRYDTRLDKYEAINTTEDTNDFFGDGIEGVLNNLSNVYGVNIDMDGNIENKIDTLYENRIYYGVDYRLKLIYCINYNNLFGTGKDYSMELDNILAEISKMYSRELNKVVSTVEITESTTEVTTTETTTETTTDITVDSLTDFINDLAGSVDTSTELNTSEFYEIWYENDDGTYYKTTERYDN